MRSKSEFLIIPRSRTTEEKIKCGKSAARVGMSNLASCWRVPSQINFVLRELRRSQLDDIQVPKAYAQLLIVRTVAVVLEVRQCW